MSIPVNGDIKGGKKSINIYLLIMVIGALMVISAVANAIKSGDPVKVEKDQIIENLPEYASRVSSIQQGYVFASMHPEILSWIPCYCGCYRPHNGRIHGSVKDCFLVNDEPLVYERHAAHCKGCVNIALDTERMYNEGRPLTDIRDYIDMTYGRDGTLRGTDTPPV